MRNFLIALMLCVLTLTTSNVFAEGYDASKRTERFGLSFYDGRPLYVVGFGRLPGNSYSAPTRCLVYRVYTGDNLSDYGTIDYGDGRGEQIYENGQYVEMMFYHYVLDDAGEPVILSASGSFAPGKESEFVRNHLKNLAFSAGGGDLAVETYDNILPNAQDWARRGILLAVALLVISAGSNKFRELTSGGSKVSSNGEDKAGSGALAYDKLSRSERKLFDAAVSGTLATGLSERLLSKDLRDAADFISGRAFGLEFDAKVQNSNRILLESFGRLSKEDQDALLEEYRNISWGASYDESIEKRFLAFRGENFADEANPFNLNRESYGGRSGRYYVARGGVLEGFNYFEGDDEEDGEPPF